MRSHTSLEPSRTLKRYIRKGVPGPMRREVWMRTSGTRRAQDKEPNLYADLLRMIADPDISDMIKIDLPRTFPNNIYFQGLQNRLYNVLIAYSNSNRRIGYCQGFNYIAGLIMIVTKDEEATFWLLRHLVEYVAPDYHTKTMTGLVTDIGVLCELVRAEVPEVYAHVKRLNLSWAVIVTKWFICLYAEVLPAETVLRIWDCVFAEGYKVR